MTDLALDEIIRTALTTLWDGLSDGELRREREVLNLFLLGHLLPLVSPSGPIYSPGQLAIEAAVPQHKTATNPRKEPDVCKDLVIWPRPWITVGTPRQVYLDVFRWQSWSGRSLRGETKRRMCGGSLGNMRSMTFRSCSVCPLSRTGLLVMQYFSIFECVESRSPAPAPTEEKSHLHGYLGQLADNTCVSFSISFASAVQHQRAVQLLRWVLQLNSGSVRAHREIILF